MERSNFESFDELYETMQRGNEIEFIFNSKKYFLLPFFENGQALGVVFGEHGTNEELICHSRQELYSINVDNKIFGEIVPDLKIIWRNF